MRSDLFGTNLESASGDRFTLQNPRMLRVALDGEVMARQGAMVAYQGEVDFAHQGSGGMGKFLKKALTGEWMPLMKVTGRGDVFLADKAWFYVSLLTIGYMISRGLAKAGTRAHRDA